MVSHPTSIVEEGSRIMQQSAIWQEVRAWPRGERLALAEKLLESVREEPAPYEVSPERREALLSLIGIWKTDQELDVDKIVEEARMSKYG